VKLVCSVFARTRRGHNDRYFRLSRRSNRGHVRAIFMNSNKTTQVSTVKDDRKARLAQELRANLQKRKAQARSRRTGEEDARPEGIAAAQTHDEEN
jgi:hypothetical protein